jgi:hypothetical protein
MVLVVGLRGIGRPSDGSQWPSRREDGIWKAAADEVKDATAHLRIHAVAVENRTIVFLPFWIAVVVAVAMFAATD